MIFRTCHCTISDCTKHALSPVLPLRTAHPNYRWPLPGNSICRNTACQLQHIHPDTSPWASSANKKSIEQQWRIWEPLRLSWVSIAWLDGHGRIFKGTLLTSDKWVIQWFISIETFWRGDEGYAVGWWWWWTEWEWEKWEGTRECWQTMMAVVECHNQLWFFNRSLDTGRMSILIHRHLHRRRHNDITIQSETYSNGSDQWLH